jgi:putative endonuclease
MRLAQGQRWEAVAGEYLEDHGLVVLERGYRCRLGELDLVCREQSTLVIVEVRARGRKALAPAVFTIDHRKRTRIIQTTRHLLMRHAEWQNATLRFDVVAFDDIDTTEPKIQWIKNAFDGS